MPGLSGLTTATAPPRAGTAAWDTPGVRALLVVLVVSVSVVGCGPPRVTHEEYVARLQATCQRHAAEAERLADRAIEGPTQMLSVLEEGLPLGRRALDELTAVRPPRTDEEAVEAFLEPAREALDDLEDARDAGERGAAQIMTALASRAGDRLLVASEAAVAYGAPSCETSGW